MALDGCCVYASWLAAAGEITKLLLLADVKPLELAVNVYVPAVWMTVEPKVAMPPTVFAVAPAVTAPGPFAANVIETPSVDTALPNWSSSCTVIGGAMATPAVALLGCCTKTSWLALAADTTKLELVIGGNKPLLAFKVYVPAVSRMSAGNVATPLLTVTGPPPLAKGPGPLATESVTCDELSCVVTSPTAFNSSTVTAGDIATPAVVAVGCCPKIMLIAGNGIDVAHRDIAKRGRHGTVRRRQISLVFQIAETVELTERGAAGREERSRGSVGSDEVERTEGRIASRHLERAL